MGFSFSRLGLLSGLYTVNAPWAVLRGNPWAQQPDRPRPIGLRALWSIDPKSRVFTIGELGFLADETPLRISSIGGEEHVSRYCK